MSVQTNSEAVPEWLTHDFVENALKEGMKNKDLKVLDFNVKVATAKGDNYCSRMFRIALNLGGNYSENGENIKHYSVIVKAMPLGIVGEEVRKMFFFEKEKEAFTKILPALHKILKKGNLCTEKLWAECYYSEGPPNDVFIFEDLQLGGFVLGNRLQGFDLEHSCFVLKTLAKFHAASLTLKEENPNDLKLFYKNIWLEDSVGMMEKLSQTFKMIANHILEWPDFDKKEIYAEKFRALEKTIEEKALESWEQKEGQMNVLLHGDAWVNNFMFKYDSKQKLEAIKLVDFQLSVWNSPAIDLQYFIVTSTALDFKFDKVDLLLKIYYEAFIGSLKKLCHDSEISYDFDQLKKDFYQRSYWGFIVFFTFFPMMASPKDETFDPEEIFNDKGDSYFSAVWKRAEIKNQMQRGIYYFESKGLL